MRNKNKVDLNCKEVTSKYQAYKMTPSSVLPCAHEKLGAYGLLVSYELGVE